MKIIDDKNIKDVLFRSQLNNDKINKAVKKIVADVKRLGDKALFKYALKFDNSNLNQTNIKVTQKEFEDAYKNVDKSLLDSLKLAIKNVLGYHSRTNKKDNFDDDKDRQTGYIIRPIESAGIYVPGGTAAYPSSVIMGVLPAVAAGVSNITVITPAKNGKINPLTLIAAAECGVKDVYKIGGAHGIAALAYGTESIKKVDIIAGPGNIYVALAKKEVYGNVGIDMIAGPSEILIICDKTANPSYVAADLLSQAEHDVLSAAYAVTDDKDLAKQIVIEIEKQLEKLPRKDIALKSILNNGAVIVVKDMDRAVEVCNLIAPEHLEIMTHSPEKLLKNIKNAGAIFIGSHTPEAVGDYFAGPCHILPTSGSARFFEVLNQDTFLKKISVIKYSKDALQKDGKHIINLAENEGLYAHANSVKIRIEES